MASFFFFFNLSTGYNFCITAKLILVLSGTTRVNKVLRTLHTTTNLCYPRLIHKVSARARGGDASAVPPWMPFSRYASSHHRDTPLLSLSLHRLDCVTRAPPKTSPNDPAPPPRTPAHRSLYPDSKHANKTKKKQAEEVPVGTIVTWLNTEPRQGGAERAAPPRCVADAGFSTRGEFAAALLARVRSECSAIMQGERSKQFFIFIFSCFSKKLFVQVFIFQTCPLSGGRGGGGRGTRRIRSHLPLTRRHPPPTARSSLVHTGV